jgi:hypothetical protein
MEIIEEDAAAATLPRLGDWFSAVAGAVTAAGVSLTLTTFGAAIGLSVISTSPTWRESSSWLWLVSGLYLVFVALWAFGLGGYVAGRLRQRSRLDPHETALRDGLQGITAWGMALVLSAGLAGLAALAARPDASASGMTAAPSTTAETLIPTELDQLFRDAKGPRDASFTYHRAEAGRILLQLSSKKDISADDKDYLTALVSAQSAVALPEATDRVNRVVSDARDAIHRARVAVVLQAFMIAAGLALGAALAWAGAVEGGKERDQGRVPEWSWMPRRAV